MSLKKLILVFSVWLTFACLFSAIGIISLDWLKYRRLTIFGIQTEEQVTAKEPDNHKIVRYSYKVKQQIYHGAGNADRGNPAFESIGVGDTLKVSYDPDHPNISFLGDPSQQYVSISRGVVFLILVGPTFALIGLYTKGWFPFTVPIR